METQISIFSKEANGLEQVIINKDGEMISLTDLWKAAGSDQSKTPFKWARTDGGNGFLKAVQVFTKRDLKSLLKSKKGKGGGTYAVKEIALEYVQYLNPSLAVLVNQIFLERAEEERDPDKILDRYENTYLKRGKSPEWITKRTKSRTVRNQFTHTLAAHGVEKNGFSNCTNAIYTGLYGGGASVVRMKKHLQKDDSIRDNIPAFELDAIAFAESLASRNIEQQALSGNAHCELASGHASRTVAKAILDNQNMDIRTAK